MCIHVPSARASIQVVSTRVSIQGDLNSKEVAHIQYNRPGVSSFFCSRRWDSSVGLSCVFLNDSSHVVVI